MDLYAWVEKGAPNEVRINVLMDKLQSADTKEYSLLLDTSNIPIGGFSEEVEIRTNDISNPVYVIQITGEILQPTSNITFYNYADKPWQQRIFIDGDHQEDEKINFIHTLQTIPDSFLPAELLDYPSEEFLGSGKQTLSIREY